MGPAHGADAGRAGCAGRTAAPADLRGTAFGVFNLVSGVALVAASVMAGWLWDAFGPAFTFYAGAVLSLIAWTALMRHGRTATTSPT